MIAENLYFNNMITPDYSDKNSNHWRELYIKIHFPEFHKYLCENYTETERFSEKIYLYFNHLDKPPVCKTCGKPVKFGNIFSGYASYCSKKCANGSEEKKSKIASTCKERFGGVAPACNKSVLDKIYKTKTERYGDSCYNNKEKAEKTMMKKYGGVGNQSKVLREKQQQTMMEKYGVDNAMRSDKIKQKMRNNNIEKYGVNWVWERKDVKEKVIKTCLERYGENENTIKNKEICSENFDNYLIENYGVDSVFKIEGFRNKIYETKKANHSFNSSKIEQLFEDYLKKEKIPYEKQYKSEDYPFCCDFYLPNEKLYIEIQGLWTHGGKPFEGTEEDLKQLELWKSKNSKFYENAIETWTIRDVKKRDIAKQNNLNYLEIYTDNIKEAINNYEQFVKEL